MSLARSKITIKYEQLLCELNLKGFNGCRFIAHIICVVSGTKVSFRIAETVDDGSQKFKPVVLIQYKRKLGRPG